MLFESCTCFSPLSVVPLSPFLSVLDSASDFLSSFSLSFVSSGWEWEQELDSFGIYFENVKMWSSIGYWFVNNFFYIIYLRLNKQLRTFVCWSVDSSVSDEPVKKLDILLPSSERNRYFERKNNTCGILMWYTDGTKVAHKSAHFTEG